MKKSFWGYNCQEADEEIRSLTGQNEKLTDQLDEVNSNLEKAQRDLADKEAELKNLQTSLDSEKSKYDSLAKNNTDTFMELSSLRTEKEELAKTLEEERSAKAAAFAQIEKLTAEKADALAQIEKLKAESKTVDTADVNSILQNTCLAVVESKRAIKGKMEENTAEFSSRWQSAVSSLNTTINSLLELNKSAEQQYEESAKSVFRSIRLMEKQLEEIKAEINESESSRVNMISDINNTISSLDDTAASASVPKKAEPTAETEYRDVSDPYAAEQRPYDRSRFFFRKKS